MHSFALIAHWFGQLRAFVFDFLVDDNQSGRYRSLSSDEHGTTTGRYRWLYAGNAYTAWTDKARKFFRVSLILLVIAVLFILGISASSLSVSKSRHDNRPSNPDFAPSSSDHPISQLVTNADRYWTTLTASQSSSLIAAVKEYQRRYGLSPPPNFEKWYRYAESHGTELIDEFDTVHDSLKLFWGLDPSSIRKRTRKALAGDNKLLGISIRDGVVKNNAPGQDNYQGATLVDMISDFSQWLPDMDLAFNIHDEPRVLVPHEDVTRLLARGSASISAAKASSTVFSQAKSRDEIDAPETATDFGFNSLDHQQTFIHSSMSCPPGSPARSLENSEDEASELMFDGIPFVNNITSYSELCLRPSARALLGTFSHPNVYAVSHYLVPIFTPSKPSTFHDIIYPSYYYFAERTSYDEAESIHWDVKEPKLYWRGATSGGFSEGGIWKHLLRQSILTKLGYSDGDTRILSRTPGSSNMSLWIGEDIARTVIKDRYDVQFTEIKQCSASDCSQMRALFGTHPHAPQQEAYKYRYLLDMDGNAFSGRFYTLLQSFSLPLKVAFFREWHIDRILPWLHYVPLTSSTDEYAEVLRYFENEAEGQYIARRLANQGREWAHKTLQKSHMQVYFFRLLLEYGRIVDDNRLNLGYVD